MRIFSVSAKRALSNYRHLVAVIMLAGFIAAPVAEAAACGIDTEFGQQEIVSPLVDSEQAIPTGTPTNGDAECVHGHCHHHQQVNVNSAATQRSVEMPVLVFVRFEATWPDSILEILKPPPRA